MDKISSGTKIMDDFLNGGYEKDVITTIYGPAGSGKTTLCMLCLCGIAKDKKIIFIDTENGFSTERLSQISENYKAVLSKTRFLRPKNFEGQKKCVENLDKTLSSKFGIVIIDTLTMLYRLVIKEEGGIHELNRQLGIQVNMLSQLAMKYQIPVIISNQVYSDFEDKTKVNMVGGDILRYGSKCLIELQVADGGLRRAVIRKHRSIEERKEITFKIVNKGIEAVKESKGFRLF